MVSVIALCFTVFIKWQLRQCAWFWITMSIFAAVHIAVILSGHWTTKWLPPSVNAGYATLDFIVMLVFLDAIARFTKTAAAGDLPA
jgi:hypothetical protein